MKTNIIAFAGISVLVLFVAGFASVFEIRLASAQVDATSSAPVESPLSTTTPEQTTDATSTIAEVIATSTETTVVATSTDTTLPQGSTTTDSQVAPAPDQTPQTAGSAVGSKQAPVSNAGLVEVHLLCAMSYTGADLYETPSGHLE